jgi:hypothetical protein
MRPHPLPACLIFLASAIAPPARADDYCVHDSAGLKQAIDRATLDWSGDSTIRLRQGTYVTTDVIGENPNNPINNDLTILGGYSDPNCAEAGRSLDPSLTILQAGAGANVAGFYFQIDGNLLLKSLTFRGYGKGVTIISPAPDFGADDQWTLDRVRIENSGGTLNAGSGWVDRALDVWTAGDADVTLQQIVFANNRDGNGECAAYISSYDDDAVVIKQSTIAYNDGTALCVDGDAQAPLDLDNNIFWGNEWGLEVTNTAAANVGVRHNTFDGALFNVEPAVYVGNDFLDPQFVDAPARDYRLLASSPAVDTGINPPTGGLPGSDVTGGPRVIGATVDRGAWETDVSSASVLLVTTAAASGGGSLAAAVQQSNDLPGTQVIRFNIPGGCPRLITQVPGQPLPEITDSVRIEGYSQPGSVRGAPPERTLCVGVTGNGQLSKLLAIALGSPASLDVSGLGFGGTALVSGAAAVTLLSGSGHVVTGNQFGDAIGPTANRVSLGVLQSGVLAGFAASDSTIGGFEPEQGNVFNQSTGAAIDIGAASAEPANFRVYGNYIGVRSSGIGALGNGIGLVVNNARGNWIWNNWISGNANDGLVLKGNADRNLVLGNQIGRCPRCLTPPLGSEILAGNALHGVLVQAGADDNVFNGNRIAGNGYGYVEEAAANRNALVYNLIYRNDGLGIDIGRDGVTPNDNGGTNPDGVQNFPLIARAGAGFDSGSVSGALTAAAERTYAIEIYASDACDASGNGEGQRLVGRGSTTTPPSPLPGIYSTASFQIPISSGGLDGKAITAIARAENGGTSEFSPCRAYFYSDVIFADGFEVALP